MRAGGDVLSRESKVRLDVKVWPALNYKAFQWAVMLDDWYKRGGKLDCSCPFFI